MKKSLLLEFVALGAIWGSSFLFMRLCGPEFGVVATAGGRVICASIDADRDAAVCRSFGVAAFPTVIVLDADRREEFRASGAAAHQGLATALEGVLARPRDRIARNSPAAGSLE